MHKVTATKEINKSATKVWEAIDDFGGIYKFHPLVESSPIINGKERGVGSERQCNFYGKGAIKERITDYQVGKEMTIEIFETGPFPLKEAVANLSIKPTGADKTEFVFSINFTPKYGPMGWIMANLIMKSQFKKTFGQVLNGLQTHVETGKIVGERGVLLEATAI